MSGVRRSGLRWPTVVVTLVIAAIALSVGLVTRHAAQNEERNLLHERASEIGLILTDSFSNLQTQMATVAAETRLNGANAQAFSAAAEAVFLPQPGAHAALADTSDAATVRFLGSGTGLARTATEAQAAMIRRAASANPPAVTSAVFGTGADRTLGIAYPVGVKNLVVYQQFPLDPAAAGSASTQSQPFDELSVALYTGKTQNTTTLVLTTGGSVPLTGTIATADTTFGADTWLVAIKAKTPLVGSFASNAYLLVLGGGLVVAIALGALVESLLRRRDYAMTLVDERTEELQDSLVKLEAAQEQVMRQERLAAIGELASAVGHELRNPLGVITNAHYLLRSQLEPTGNETMSRHLATAEREVGAATLIVSDLLDFSRAREPVTTPVDIPELVAEVRDVIPPPNGITLTSDAAAACPPAKADRDQLRQVLLNLVTNAYEAIPDGGTVSLHVEPHESQVRITVVDTGTGMDEETRTRVFEPFFTRKARGIGLGLAVTKRIVDSHGGTISVVSTPGSGSTFTVDLPTASGGPES